MDRGVALSLSGGTQLTSGDGGALASGFHSGLRSNEAQAARVRTRRNRPGRAIHTIRADLGEKRIFSIILRTR